MKARLDIYHNFKNTLASQLRTPNETWMNMCCPMTETGSNWLFKVHTKLGSGVEPKVAGFFAFS